MDAIKLKEIDGENVDYDFDTENPIIISELDQLVQSLKNEVKQNRGQWWHNTNLGMPYLKQPNGDGLMERRHISPVSFESALRTILDNYKEEILRYEFLSSTINPLNRLYSCAIRIVTIYGEREVRF